MSFLLHGPSPYRTEIRVRDIDNLGSHHRRTMFPIKRLAFRRLPIGDFFILSHVLRDTEGIASIGRRPTRCLLLLFFSPAGERPLQIAYKTALSESLIWSTIHIA